MSLAKRILTIASLVLMSASQSFAYDVYGTDNLYIKVTKSRDQLAAKFELCPKGESKSCRILGEPSLNGKVQYYLLSDLQDQQFTENAQIAGSIVGDVVAVVGLVYAGAVVAPVAAGAITTTTLVGGASVGAVTAGVGIYFIDALNPKEQWRQARMIEDDVINDQKVIVKGKVQTYAKSLDTVLKKLSPVSK